MIFSGFFGTNGADTFIPDQLNPLKESFLSLLQAHQGLIHHLCRMYYHESCDQEDAFQEIVLSLWKAYPEYRGEAKFSTWMYKIALYTLLKMKERRGQRLALKDLSGMEAQYAKEPRPDRAPSEEFMAFLGGLKALDRALLILHLEDYNYQEISSILGISPSNVGTRLNRIKTTFKKKYQKQYDGME